MRTISTMLAMVACFIVPELAQAQCGGAAIRANCSSATAYGASTACGVSAVRVRAVTRQRVGILARIAQASVRSSCGSAATASCGAAVQSCGQAVQSCGQAVQSCGQSCGQAVQSCGQSCEQSAESCGCGLAASSNGLGVANSNDGIAYAKSAQQAQQGRMRHVGGSMGTGHYEGVGMSSVSAEDAIQRACYYGQKEIVGKSVVQGPNGYFYATVLYN